MCWNFCDVNILGQMPTVIDWSEFSSGSALVVIRYVYTGEFLPDTSGHARPNEVWRIAQRCQLSKLADLINPVFREGNETVTALEECQSDMDNSGSISELDLSVNPAGSEGNEIICMEKELRPEAVTSGCTVKVVIPVDSVLSDGSETVCAGELRPETNVSSSASDLVPPVNPIFGEGNQSICAEECRSESNTSGSVTEVDISASPPRAKRSLTPDLFADEERTKEEEDLIDLTQEESDGNEFDGARITSGTPKSLSLESLPVILDSSQCRADADEIG